MAWSLPDELSCCIALKPPSWYLKPNFLLCVLHSYVAYFNCKFYLLTDIVMHGYIRIGYIKLFIWISAQIYVSSIFSSAAMPLIIFIS